MQLVLLHHRRSLTLIARNHRSADRQCIVDVVVASTIVRQADARDVAELVRLRHAMFRAMAATGAAASPERVEDDSWYPAARAAIADRMARGVLGAFVIDDSGAVTQRPRERGLVACAVATLGAGLPGPGFPRGRNGSMSTVFVEPAHRGRGLARALVEAALEWLDDHRAEVIDLHATPQAERLYREFGFDSPRSPALRRLRSEHPHR